MELEEFGFYKSHKSFLINLNMMESLDKEFVYFCGNKRACVSVRRYVETKKKYIATKKRFASM